MPDESPRHRLAHALPDLRALDGCPRAGDGALLDASLPPTYTACPNPFLAEFVSQGSGAEARAPGSFAADISEGRSDAIYRAQVYHTKVPPQAIARYIEHFCPPEGLVFDGFCGSGMTGVAARMTGRRAILVDLSPAATAIAATYCSPVDLAEARRACGQVVTRLREACGWLYAPVVGGEMDYTIWAEVYRCPHCGDEAPFSAIGFDFATKRPKKDMICPACRQAIKPAALERVIGEDGITREAPVRAKAVGERGDRAPTRAELALLARIAGQPVPYPFPEAWMMSRQPSEAGWGDMWRRGYHRGVWRVADFYAKRTLWAVAAAVGLAAALDAAPEVRHLVRTSIINASVNLTKMHRAYQGPLPLVLYFPRIRRECNVIRALEQRLATTLDGLEKLPPESRVMISTQSSTSLPNIPENCVDYIFTDPPFGQNIIYSEVNFLWESWLGITTAQQQEAIISRGQHKGIGEYGDLMQRCFAEFRRILKPGRWMTVEFHNSRNEVWTAIQGALEGAGFSVEDVRILDKQQVSFKQASTENAVQRDLVISARKPESGQMRLDFSQEREPEVWDFVARRLQEAQEPAERDKATLYSRLVQHWLAHGWRVPLDAEEFYRELRLRYGADL